MADCSCCALIGTAWCERLVDAKELFGLFGVKVGWSQGQGRVRTDRDMKAGAMTRR